MLISPAVASSASHCLTHERRKKNCGATPVSFRLFSSPEFLVKFTHSTKFPRLRQTSVDDKLQREISVVVARRIKPPPQVVPERVVDVAITRKLVETLHSAWNKLFSGNDATAIDRHDGFASARFYFLR